MQRPARERAVGDRAADPPGRIAHDAGRKIIQFPTLTHRLSRRKRLAKKGLNLAAAPQLLDETWDEFQGIKWHEADVIRCCSAFDNPDLHAVCGARSRSVVKKSND